MRKIKFRGKINNEWVYGGFTSILGTRAIVSNNGTFHYIDEKTIGEYTGLNDKNRMEIYEGDKIKHKNPKPFKDSIYEVVFLNGGFAIKNNDYIEDLNEFLKYSSSAEVIGNIYE